MNKKKLVIILVSCGIVAIILGIILKVANNSSIFGPKIEIIDATFSCGNSPEEFYSDDKYTYYFSCQQSNSVYVKYENGNKELVVTALENKNVTIKQLENAGLKFYKNEK